MQIKEIMTRSVQTIAAQATLGDAARKMESTQVGFLPVVQDGAVIGVVTDRDITVRAVSRGLDAENTRVTEAMTSRLVALPESSEVEKATEVMERRRVRRLLVTDEQRGSLTGVVSLDKLALYVGRYGMAMDDEFEGEANADTREFSAGFDPAALADDLDETDTAIGGDPSVTSEAQVVERDARDQSDPRSGPRKLIRDKAG
jgi:CBS domain-containing protein